MKQLYWRSLDESITLFKANSHLKMSKNTKALPDQDRKHFIGVSTETKISAPTVQCGLCSMDVFMQWKKKYFKGIQSIAWMSHCMFPVVFFCLVVFRRETAKWGINKLWTTRPRLEKQSASMSGRQPVTRRLGREREGERDVGLPRSSRLKAVNL